MNGQELSAYALTPTPAEARLIRELRRYNVMPQAPIYDEFKTQYHVYIWQAARKQFRHIGRASNFSDADLVIRAHIRQRRRSRARTYGQFGPPFIWRRCGECGRLNKRFYCDLCLEVDQACEFVPDDDPSFDPLFLL